MKRSVASAAQPSPLAEDATTRPKSLIRLGVGDRPFLDYVLANAKKAGYRDIVLVIGERDALMRRYYGEKETGNDFQGMTISYAVQPIPPGRERPLGTADAVLCGALSRPDWKGSQFTVCNSDNIYSAEAMATLRTSPHPHAVIAYDTRGLRFEKEQEYNNAILEKDEDGYLSAIVEKPGAAMFERIREEHGSVEVSMNILRFRYDAIVPFLEATPVHAVRHEKEIATALSLLIADQPRTVFCFSRNEFVPDLTSAKDISAVREYVRNAYPNGPFG